MRLTALPPATRSADLNQGLAVEVSTSSRFAPELCFGASRVLLLREPLVLGWLPSDPGNRR